MIVDAADKKFTLQQRTNEIQLRMMLPCILLTSLLEKDGQYQVFSKGNPRVVLQNCTDYFDGTNILRLAEADRQKINTLLM